MEEHLRDALFRDARSMLERLFNDRSLIPDAEAARPMEVIHRDRSHRVQTLFGIIELRRHYYYHLKAKQGRFPLDHHLDLVRGHTPGIARLICRASSQSASYQGAAADLKAYTGLNLDSRGFSRFVAEIMPELREAQASLPTAADPTRPIPILYLASDGTGVPLRPSELQDTKGRQPDGSARTREAKLGCVFTQTSTGEEGEPLRDPDSTTYVGTFDDCRALGSLLRAEAFRRGYTKAQATVYLGDGAHWIWENARLNFPDAQQILDFYHASEHAGELAAALHGAGPAAKAQQATWCHQMKEQGASAVISGAQAQLEERRHSMSPEQIENVERQIGYFTNNLERMHYGEFRKNGYFIGSGVVEAGCKTVVGHRLKQSGMFWSHKGGDDILALRCITLGPAFLDIWNARLPILSQIRSKPPKWSASPN